MPTLHEFLHAEQQENKDWWFEIPVGVEVWSDDALVAIGISTALPLPSRQ
jgi:hypothetical protein